MIKQNSLLALVTGVIFCLPQYAYGQLSDKVYLALDAMERGVATESQQALLFQNNRLINYAGINGYLPDQTYQKAQQNYAEWNQKFAGKSARAHDAVFTVQNSKFPNYSFGTDSDYILKVMGENPVERIGLIRDDYNSNINQWLEKNLDPEDYDPTIDDWHRRLDTDLMADPRFISKEDFQRLADRYSPLGNNDGYSRPMAAEYEAKIRGKQSVPLPDHYKKLENALERERNQRLEAKRDSLTPDEFAKEKARLEAIDKEILHETRMREPSEFTAMTDGKGNIVDLQQPDEITDAINTADHYNDVSPEVFKEYAAEMNDFAKYKNAVISKIRQDPDFLANDVNRAKAQITMAQEQKYISRLEEANQTLRQKAGLKTQKISGTPIWEFTNGPDGELIARKRLTGTLASAASKRKPGNFNTTWAAHNLAENSLARAKSDLAVSMAQAAYKDFEKWGSGLDQIGEITADLTDAQKGAVIQRVMDIGDNHSKLIAREVAKSMRDHTVSARPKGPKFLSDTKAKLDQYRAKFDANARAAGETVDAKMKGSIENFMAKLGVTDDYSEMSKLRRAFNENAGDVMDQLSGLNHVGTALDMKEAYGHAKTWVNSINQAMDPNTTDAEADALFAKAEQAGYEMAKAGTLGAISELVPTFGALYGGYSIGYDGTRYILENTETGQRFEHWKAEKLADKIDSFNAAADHLMELAGLESERQRLKQLDEEQKEKLKQAYWRALKNGTIKLKSGAKTFDIADMIDDGNLNGIAEWIEPGPNASEATIDRLLERKREPQQKVAAKRNKGGLDDGFIAQDVDFADTNDAEDELTEIERKSLSAYGSAERVTEEGLPDQDQALDQRAERLMAASSEKSRKERLQELLDQYNKNREQQIASEAKRLDNKLTEIEREKQRQAASRARSGSSNQVVQQGRKNYRQPRQNFYPRQPNFFSQPNVWAPPVYQPQHHHLEPSFYYDRNYVPDSFW